MPFTRIVRVATRHLWFFCIALPCLAFPRIPETLPPPLLLFLLASGMGLDYAIYVRRFPPPAHEPGRGTPPRDKTSASFHHLRQFFLEYPAPARLSRPQWVVLGLSMLVVGFFTLYGNTVRGLYLGTELISRQAGMSIPGFLFNQETAFATLRAKAEQGDPAAMFFMIMDNRHPQDEKTKLEWIRKSAERGYPAAHNVLGTRYMRGEGLPRDCRKAIHHLSEYMRTLHASPEYERDGFLTWAEKTSLRHLRALLRRCGQKDRRAIRREDAPTADSPD